MTSANKKLILLFILIGIFTGIMLTNAPVIDDYAKFLARRYTESIPETEIIQISSNLDREEVKTVNISVNSAVRILSRNTEGMIAGSTGTLFEHDDVYYVVTVAHGLVGDCSATIVWTGQKNLTPCRNIVVIDRETDYAILRIDEPLSVEAVTLKEVVPRERQWSKLLSLQNKIFYTGFPNSVGPLTISGRIIGFSENDYIFIHSYAWSGSSGSGVFSADGKFIGIVIAVDVGQTVYGVDVLEDMVVVLPANLIPWDTITGEQ